MTLKKALEQWEIKIANTEVTSQAIWPIAKSAICHLHHARFASSNVSVKHVNVASIIHISKIH
jgi:hypothetical protein